MGIPANVITMCCIRLNANICVTWDKKGGGPSNTEWSQPQKSSSKSSLSNPETVQKFVLGPR